MSRLLLTMLVFVLRVAPIAAQDVEGVLEVLGDVDLGALAVEINSALSFMERAPVDEWRLGEEDDRARLFPKGTRVVARGHALLWSIPREEGASTEQVLQVAVADRKRKDDFWFRQLILDIERKCKLADIARHHVRDIKATFS